MVVRRMLNKLAHQRDEGYDVICCEWVGGGEVQVSGYYPQARYLTHAPQKCVA